MRKTILLALVSILTAASGAASAQARYEASAFGTWNSLSGSSGTRDHDWDASYLQLNLGYYIGPQLVGFLGYERMGKVRTASGEDKSFSIVDAGLKYYIGSMQKGQFAGFVEGAIGLANFNGSDLALRVGLGGSYFLTDSVSVDPSFTYLKILTGDNLNGHIIGLRLTARF